MSQSLYFIDTKLSDYQSIIDSLFSADTYYLIDSDSDGLTQMASLLSGYSNLDAIHLFSHGSIGSLNLGNTIVNQDNISSYELLLQQIGSSLSANGDILLYGCNIAQGDVGQVFIDTIASYTGIGVAASTDLTGSSALGGDWVLEANSGSVETQTLVANYASTMGTTMVQLEALNNTTSLDSAPQITSVGTTGEYVVTFWGPDSALDYSIFVQKFNANGTVAGAMVQLEALNKTNGSDSAPQITSVGTAGEYVVTFQGVDSAGDKSIFVQKFNANGTVAGAMVQLEALNKTNGSDSAPQITSVGTAGEYVVTFYGSDNSEGDLSIFVQKFNANGTVAGAMVQLEALNNIYGTDANPQITSVGTSGEYVVTFYGIDSAGDYSIFVQKFNANGTVAGVTVQLEALNNTTGIDFATQITSVGTSGEYVVTFYGADSAGDKSIFVQKFNANGTVAGAMVQLEALNKTNGNDYDPQITSVGTAGEYVVTFQGVDSAGDSSIFVQKFNANGTVAGAMVQLEALNNTTSLDSAPQITSVGTAGEYVVTFCGPESAGDNSIFVQKFNANGTVQGAIVQLEALNNTIGFDATPQITSVGTAGDYVVTFYGTDSAGDYSIFVQKFNADEAITGANSAPTSANITLTTNEDTAKVLTLSDFAFTDIDAGNTLSKVQITTLPTAGTLALNAVAVTFNQEITVTDITAGKLIFTPAANANGTEYSSFGFKLSDGTVYSTTANIVTFDVTAINDAPTSTNTTTSTNEGAPLNATLPSAIDVDGDAISYTLAHNPYHGTATVVTNGSYTYTPDINFSGIDLFSYSVSDGNGGSNSYSVKVDVLETNTASIPTTALANFSDVAKLYVATFNRAPDAAGLDWWVYSSGLGIEQIAQSFFDQNETKALYPTGTSNTSFVVSVYDNLFNRSPDQAGQDYWVQELNTGNIAKQNFILAVMNGALDTNVSLDKTILDNKMNIGLFFAQEGLNDVAYAKSVMEYVDATVTSVEDSLGIIMTDVALVGVNGNVENFF